MKPSHEKAAESPSAAAESAPQAHAGSGAELYALVRELYPICRSITGQGVRDTLAVLERRLPLERTSLATGTRLFDWEVPREWNIREAWIADPAGRRVVDFADSNLHVVNYSVPVRARMSLDELRQHLHSIPDHPDWVPYRTSYYRESWGFCLTHRQLQALVPGEYEVCIDATLAPGKLTYAELVIPGETSEEIVFFTHICHPSLCNDNLSAIAVTTALAQRARAMPRRHTLRFIFAPATIGSIAWLTVNQASVGRIRHGMVLASLGDAGQFTYKRSRRGNAVVDRVAEYLLTTSHRGACEDFSPYGYDERQFCSPGFDLPFGRLTRTANGRYPEYHTSADNLGFISAQALEESLRACEAALAILDGNAHYLNLKPHCEPRLGKHGLFRPTGGHGPSDFEHAVLWVLNQSDGARDLLEIAVRAKLDFALVESAARQLETAGLVRRLTSRDGAGTNMLQSANEPVEPRGPA
jgi:aminopeptidase-like protein